MRKTYNIPQQILANIDFMNTVNGGRVEPTVVINEQSNQFEALVSVPGLEPDKLMVEVVNNQLLVYYFQPVLNNIDNESAMMIPVNVKTFDLPYFVDEQAIRARYNDRQWRIVIPFNDKAQGFRKSVEIEM
ncbi:MAG: Hsp20/alpha crystallin family protein [Spirosomaceae bacterium]|jgi:HSP20 family molecular chaperone IbpA|nr:Hsp20/alpha crystallin family protein [Spirosomataceae bacterium]